MYHVAEIVGCRIGEIEAWPIAELLEWADWEASKRTGKAEQSPDDMLREAMRISRHGSKATR